MPRGYNRATDSALGIVAVTQSDTTNDPNGPFRGIIFVTVGAIKIRTHENVDVTLPSGLLAAGVIHPLRVKRVFTTGTTAATIYGVT